MSNYLVVVAVVFGINLLPAFAPPTWSVLVFFAFNQNLNEVALIALGVISATSARYLLAIAFRKNQHRFPVKYIQNLENAGSHLRRSTGHLMASWLLFFVSPFSSAQLFEAAGLMKNVQLRPLALAFGAGRIFTYSIYVLGTSAFAATSLGQLIRQNITSPLAIVIQILFILGLVALGLIKWRPYQESA